MKKFIFLFVTLQVVYKLVLFYTSEVNSSENGAKYENSSQALSRRKRFLLFPDGSSFQLVFCVQNSALIAIGDIFLFGNTLSLAWALPTDPKYLTMLKNKDIFGAQRMDVKSQENRRYEKEDLSQSSKKSFKKQSMKKASFAKRSAESPVSLNREKRPNRNIDKRRMHEKQLSREYLKTEHMSETSVRFHRSSRVDLYEKLEKLFEAVGRDGRQCVLRKLCEAAQLQPRQATFLQEILHVVFKLPQEKSASNDSSNDSSSEYDRVHEPYIDCSSLYPDCGSVDILNSL